MDEEGPATGAGSAEVDMRSGPSRAEATARRANSGGGDSKCCSSAQDGAEVERRPPAAFRDRRFASDHSLATFDSRQQLSSVLQQTLAVLCLNSLPPNRAYASPFPSALALLTDSLRPTASSESTAARTEAEKTSLVSLQPFISSSRPLKTFGLSVSRFSG